MGERYQRISEFLRGRSAHLQARLANLESNLSCVVDQVAAPRTAPPFLTFTLSSPRAGTTVTLREEEIAEVRSTPDGRTMVVRMDDGTEFTLRA
ncbi:MAG: hypothetical protein AB1816_05565 [Bacillota bacterium]|nr:hypothetical protein [Bacillota bacterium]MDI7249165.1 hypothetical protein [Bacillota bacterium]